MRCFLFAGLACLLMGCSGEDAGITIMGKVTFSDGTPLTKGVISVTNDFGSSRGAIKEDGTFKLDNVKNGDYQVAITGANEGGASGGETGDDSMQYDEQGNVIESAPKADPKSLIAEKYADPTKSGLTLKVPSEKYEVQVEKL